MSDKPKQPHVRAAPARDEEPTGAFITDTSRCVCGHMPYEHGRDPRYPASTACFFSEHCQCITYEPND